MKTSDDIARTLTRYRGSLLGGIASAAAIALTLDPGASIAHSSVRFALAFAVVATFLAIVLTATVEIARYFAARSVLPKAIARPRRAISVEFVDE